MVLLLPKASNGNADQLLTFFVEKSFLTKFKLQILMFCHLSILVGTFTSNVSYFLMFLLQVQVTTAPFGNATQTSNINNQPKQLALEETMLGATIAEQ